VTALKAGETSTGHAMPPNVPGFLRAVGPIALNLFMAPGEDSLEALIASTDRGLYITRFWYTRLVHPRDCVVTGMTRDGVFLIENGELAYPVKNLRFTQSYVGALAGVEKVGRDTRLLKTEYGSRAVHVPALKLSGFNFTGVTV
jgi:predicted Zn-dependent protease